MKDDRIQIRGTREGINAVIDMEHFNSFDEMLNLLIEKLLVGKSFYKGSSIKIIADLKKVNEIQIGKLKDILFDKIKIRECIFQEEKETEEKERKAFSGVYEGKTKFIKKTIRSGQLVNYHGNIVVIGDINHGAEVYAGGNIVVLGTIRGHVHAGFGGNKKAIVSAFSLEPEVLQIGDVITVAPDDEVKPQYPELAKVKDNMIVVEPYLPKKYLR